MEDPSFSATMIQFIFALSFVIALLYGLAYLAKRFGLMARVTVDEKQGSEKRLNIVEILPVDAKRRLMIIRRDDKEHLILLGTERDLLIESDIELPQNEKLN